VEKRLSVPRERLLPTAISKLKRNTGLSEREYQLETQAQACRRRLRMAILTVDREVSALGQMLAQQAVRVLAGAKLPGAVKVAE
jgi:hypothetical protein